MEQKSIRKKLLFQKANKNHKERASCQFREISEVFVSMLRTSEPLV